MSSDGSSVMSIETLQYSSPPPKPPRRKYSEKLSKTGCVTNQKKQGISSFGSSFQTLPEKCSTSGCESLPASWIQKHFGNHDAATNTDFQMHNPNIRTSFCSLPFQRSSVTTSAFSISKNFVPSVQSLAELQSNSDQISSCLQNINQNSPISSNLYLPETVLLEDCQKNFEFLGQYTVCHRRHHSDPTLSKSLKKESSGITFKNQCTPLKPNHSNEETMLMLQEIKSLKSIVDMLWQQLCSVQRELDTTLNRKFSTKSGLESPCTFAELIHDIYNAQKEKEKAIEKRLQIIEEERNFAIKTLEDVLQVAIRFENPKVNEDESSDKELKKLFHQLESTQNPLFLLQQQSLVLTYLYNSKENKLKQLTEKLNACIAEKMESKQKIDKLQEDLVKWKTTRYLLHSDVQQWESSLLDTLCQVISQRDSAMMKVQHLKEQIHALQSEHNNIQMLPMPNTDLQSESYENWQASNVNCKDSHGFIKAALLISGDGGTASDTFNDEFSYLKARIVELSDLLDVERSHRQIAEENCHKLERVVLLLRRRINGINLGVSV